MTLIEAMAKPLTEPVELEDKYHLQLYVDGATIQYKPVDFRLNRIRIPLRDGDVSFIYDKVINDEKLFKIDYITRIYYPIGTQIHLNDGSVVQVYEYGPVEQYQNMYHVAVYTKPVNYQGPVLEAVPSKSITNKVIKELNTMIISNEHIKCLLPRYSWNLMEYDDEDINNESYLKTYSVLNMILEMEYNEYYVKQSAIYDSLENFYDNGFIMVGTEQILDIIRFAKVFTEPRIMLKYVNAQNLFRPTTLATWFIDIAVNYNEALDYKNIYLLNKNNDRCAIDLSYEIDGELGCTCYCHTLNDGSYDIIVTFKMPDMSKYDYDIQLGAKKNEDVTYTSYIIDTLSMFRTNKSNGDRIEIESVKDNPDNFKMFAKLIDVLSAYNVEEDLQTYYDNILVTIENIDVSEPEPPQP